MADEQVTFWHLAAQWDITKGCDFHCLHCISGAGKRFDTYRVSTESAKVIAQRIGELGVAHVSWSGGEPLLRSDLEGIMLHGQRHGVQTFDMVTNGYSLTNERIELLIRAGLKGAQISIDGIDPRQNSILRKGPKDCFVRAVSAIKRCHQHGMPVVLGVMLYPEMVSTLDQMYDLAALLGVAMLRFSGFVPNGRGDRGRIRQRMALSYDEMSSFLDFLSRRYDEHPGFMGLDYSFGLNPFCGRFESTAGRNHFFIDYKGDVFPSTGMEREIFKLGNVLEEDLAEILKRPTLVPPSPQQSELTGKCATCDKFDVCNGGPRGISFMFSGRLDASPEVCLYHELRRRKQHTHDWNPFLAPLSASDLIKLRALIEQVLNESLSNEVTANTP